MAGGRHDVLLRHGRCTEQGGEREAETARSDRPAPAQGRATAVRVAAATIPQPERPVGPDVTEHGAHPRDLDTHRGSLP